MAKRHIIAIIGGGEIVVGAALNLWPAAPAWISYALMVFGVATIAYAIYDWKRDRRLGWWQRRKLANALTLRNWPAADARVLFRSGCEECETYAKQIAQALRVAGWNGEPYWTPDEFPGVTGLRIVTRDPSAPPPLGQVLAAALTCAKVRFDWWANVDMSPHQADLHVYPKD